MVIDIGPLRQKSPEEVQEKPGSDRLKLALKGSRSLVENAKRTLEMLHGRELSWDETFQYLFQYVDLPAERSVAAEVSGMLLEVKSFLEKNRDDEAALAVQLFSDAIVSTLESRMDRGKLVSALIELE